MYFLFNSYFSSWKKITYVSKIYKGMFKILFETTEFKFYKKAAKDHY